MSTHKFLNIPRRKAVVETIPDRRKKARDRDRRNSPRFRCSLPVLVRKRIDYYRLDPNYIENTEIINISNAGVRIGLKKEIERLSNVVLNFYLQTEDFENYQQYQDINAKVVSISQKNIDRLHEAGLFFVETPISLQGVPKILGEYA